MKNFVLFILATCLFVNVNAQLKTTQKCDAFVVDILDGKVNDVHLGFTKGQIGPNFKGKLSIPLMGGKRGSFYKWLGLPKLKDTNWDAYETQYGCLILYYDAQSKVRMIRFSSKTTDDINLCE